MPGAVTARVRWSASIIGRECGGEERMRETVDLPVAREPVRPIRIMVVGGGGEVVGFWMWVDGCGGVWGEGN